MTKFKRGGRGLSSTISCFAKHLCDFVRSTDSKSNGMLNQDLEILFWKFIFIICAAISQIWHTYFYEKKWLENLRYRLFFQRYKCKMFARQFANSVKPSLSVSLMRNYINDVHTVNAHELLHNGLLRAIFK